MELSRFTRFGLALAWLAAVVMLATAWLIGQKLHSMHYGGGCVFLGTCAAGLAVLGSGWFVLRRLGVRIVKCRSRTGGTVP